MATKDRTAKELIRILGSKKTLYDYFTDCRRFLIPDYKVIDLGYLYQLLSGEKVALSLNDVKPCLSSDKVSLLRDEMQNYCLSHEKLNKYMPDTPTDRDFIIKVIAILDPEYYNKIFEVSKTRYLNSKKTMRKIREIQIIKVCPEFGRILFLIPNFAKPPNYSIAPKTGEIDEETFTHGLQVYPEIIEKNEKYEPKCKKKKKKKKNNFKGIINVKKDESDERDFENETTKKEEEEVESGVWW